MASKLKSALCAALLVAGAWAGMGGLTPSLAQEQSPQSPAGSVRTAAAAAPAGYYVEFRAAEMGVYGHSYIAYGRLGAGGRPITAQYADFHPGGGNIGLAVGHVVPVAANMTPEKEMLALPITTAYRVKLSAADYKKVLEAIRRAHATNHVWSALAYNCNSFVADVAQAIGLKTPATILFASAFVPALRDMNIAPADAAAAKRPPVRRTEATARDTTPRRLQQAPARQPST